MFKFSNVTIPTIKKILCDNSTKNTEFDNYNKVIYLFSCFNAPVGQNQQSDGILCLILNNFLLDSCIALKFFIPMY